VDKTVTNSRKSTQEAGVVRLDSWKEIAAYLGKSIRTVQRWEEQEKLPIHRLPHADRSSVFAYPQELEAWRASRSHLLENRAEDIGSSGGAIRRTNTANPPPEQGESLVTARRWPLGALAAVVVLAASGLILYSARPAPSLQVISYTQLTHDGRWKIGLASDGVSAYFIEQSANGRDLCKISINGGEITHFPLDLPTAALIALSPDGTKLLVEEETRLNDESNAWVISTTGKALRRMGIVITGPFAWAPAGRILYARDSGIWTCDEDGGHSTRVHQSSDSVLGLGWSPDAKRLWYTTVGRGASPLTVGEIDADGSSQRLILRENGPDRGYCCGFWSGTEGSFGFLSYTSHQTDLLVAPDSWADFFRPQSISRTVLGLPEVSGFAADAPHGRFLVLAAGLWHANVYRYDQATGQFVSYFDGLSAHEIDFSPDGLSAVYVDGYDGSLWRYDLKDRRKTRLTDPPLYAMLPRWSPDGQWIAVTIGRPEGRWRIYRLPARGGTPERVIKDDEDEGAATWSPDGKSLAFGKVDCALSGNCAIYRYDLAAHFLRMLPGSQGFRTARWSPDGKYIAALRAVDESLVLFDFATQHWKVIHGPVLGDTLNWSRDSKYIYGYVTADENPVIFRVDVITGTTERVASLKGIEQAGRQSKQWFGLAPDGSPIISRESSENELISVSYRTP
jgi:Tol biopolymer transport system component